MEKEYGIPPPYNRQNQDPKPVTYKAKSTGFGDFTGENHFQGFCILSSRKRWREGSLEGGIVGGSLTGAAVGGDRFGSCCCAQSCQHPRCDSCPQLSAAPPPGQLGFRYQLRLPLDCGGASRRWIVVVAALPTTSESSPQLPWSVFALGWRWEAGALRSR